MAYPVCRLLADDPTPQGILRPGSPSLTWTHPEPLLNWRAASTVTPGGRASWESWLCLGVSKLGHRQLSQEALTEVCSTGQRQTSLCLPPGPPAVPSSPGIPCRLCWGYRATCQAGGDTWILGAIRKGRRDRGCCFTNGKTEVLSFQGHRNI